MRKITCILLTAFMLISHHTLAQQIGWEVNANGFFDNSEGEESYRLADTFSGLHVAPQLSLSTDRDQHRLVAGYDVLLHSGASPSIDADGLVAYYQYRDDRYRFVMGKYPRRLQQETMASYLLCDSFQYYRPYMTGIDFLYVGEKGYVEAFLDWTYRRGELVREQFMAGAMARRRLTDDYHVGINGYYYHYANIRPGHELEKPDGYGIHDYLVAHPYAGFESRHLLGLDSLTLRAGLLMSVDRARAGDGKWHVPMGVLGEVEAHWKRLSLSQIVYTGKRQQYYGGSGFQQYYWNDAYYRSPFYSRTDLSYLFYQDRIATLKFSAAFHLTDAGLHWNQILTLTVRMGS